MAVKHVYEIHGDLIAINDDGSQTYLKRSNNGLWVQGGSAVENNTGNPPTGQPGNDPVNNGNYFGNVTAEMVEAAVTSVNGSISAMMFTSSEIASAFNQAIQLLAPGEFATKARLACLVGQCAQETDWYKTTKEYGGETYDYAPYYGRGFIQLTHLANYQAFGNWLASRGVTTDPSMFVNNPDLILQLPYAAYAAIFYFTQVFWNGHNLAWFCDTCGGATTGSWYQISRAINRGSPYSQYAAYGEAVRDTAVNAVYAATQDPSASNLGENAKQFALSVLGRFFYTQTSLRNDMMNTNAGDCSSFVVLCYTETSDLTNEHFGGSGSYPGYTGTLSSSLTQINLTGNESEMAIGDLILNSWSNYNPTFDHVSMYIGDNQIVGHGGPDKGPTIGSLSGLISSSYHVKVVRP